MSVAINCHPERSEGSRPIARRSFAALRMTVIDLPVLRTGESISVAFWNVLLTLRVRLWPRRPHAEREEYGKYDSY